MADVGKVAKDIGMGMTYGVPYQGSKSAIAESIISALPRANCFVDLFFGGGALTHCAMLSGKYKHYVINDITPFGMDLFCNAIDGKYKNECRWVSREEFFELKDIDPYVRICWSFGSDCRTYLYAREIEDYKHCLHMVIVEGNYTPMKERYGLDFSPLDEMGGDFKQRRLNLKKIMERYHKEGKIGKRGSHYILNNNKLMGGQAKVHRLVSTSREPRKSLQLANGRRKSWCRTPRINAANRTTPRVRSRGNDAANKCLGSDTSSNGNRATRGHGNERTRIGKMLPTCGDREYF